MLAAYGVFTFGPYFALLSNFSYFYTAVVLFVMSKIFFPFGFSFIRIERNIVFEDDEEGVRYRMMSSNIGTYSFNMVFLLFFALLTFKADYFHLYCVEFSYRKSYNRYRTQVDQRNS